jgi:RNA-directed DNA polymerase
MNNLTSTQLTIELLACAKRCGNSVQKSLALPQLASQCQALALEILQGRYQPGTHSRFAVREPKLREVFAPSFRDRLVQQWLIGHIQPTVEKQLIDDSYACRPGKGNLAAISKVQRHMRQPGHGYFLQLDIHSFFNSIPRAALNRAWHQLLSKTPHRGHRMALLLQIGERAFLYDASRAPHTLSGSRKLLANIPPHKRLDYRGATHGIPIGSLTSQVLANYYLNPLDQFIKHQLRIKGYVRYMDDLLLLGPDPATLNNWKQAIDCFLTEQLQLRLHPTKQQLQPCRHGARYLGYRVFAHHRWLLPRTCATFKARLAWFNHLLDPSQPPAAPPLRGSWARPEALPVQLDAGLLRSILATLNSYYGLLAQGNHWHLRQQFYHRHAGVLKRYYRPADAQYSHLRLRAGWQRLGQGFNHQQAFFD